MFRHFDSATVVKGLVGDDPKTAWVIDYPLLERIHYLLVAGYDVYGNAGLQLFSRLYMDFLRIGGEFNFLYFLPPDARTAAIDNWYRGAEDNIAGYLAEYQQLFAQATGIAYAGGDPKAELYAHLKARVGPALSHHYDLDRAALPTVVARRSDADSRDKGSAGVVAAGTVDADDRNRSGTTDRHARPQRRSHECRHACSTNRRVAFRKKTRSRWCPVSSARIRTRSSR